MSSLTGNPANVPPLEIHDLTVAYRNKPVLWGIDLVAPAGKLIGIVGPNGAGKSTLIKACMGLLPCSSGWVTAFGRPVTQSLNRVGYVPQRESVDWDFPVSVMDVVLMGRYGRIGLFKRPSSEDRWIARECLEQVQMLPFSDRQISNLSGGQQQRVFLARALAQESDMYFMDEPFAGVDPIAVLDIQKIIRFLKERSIGVLITDHNVRETLGICDRAYIINQGSVLASGMPNEIVYNENVRRVYLGENFRL